MTGRGRVLISADDFGLTPGVNRAIIGALDAGLITSTAIITGHPGTAEALAFAADRPDLDLGIHINLTDGLSLTRNPRLGGLIDSSGTFRGRKHLASAVSAGAVDLDAVRSEVNAQIDLCRQHGLTLTHCDSHHYIHGLDGIGSVIRHSTAEAGIPTIRAFGWRCLLSPIASAATLGRRRLGPTDQLIRADGARSRESRVASDYVVPLGLPQLGPVSPRIIARILDSMSGAVVEIVSHPGYVDAELAERSNYVGERQRELAVLTSGTVGQLVEDSGLRLTTFREQAAARQLPRGGPALT